VVTIHGNCVEFRFYRPDAREVCLVGDFVNWQVGRCWMKPAGRGEWVAQMMLPTGDYKFRYYVDGQWFADYAAFGVECGPFGLDSVLRVPPPRPAPARRLPTAAVVSVA
jgi:1,4-alpha-glucan branching enzyme